MSEPARPGRTERAAAPARGSRASARFAAEYEGWRRRLLDHRPDGFSDRVRLLAEFGFSDRDIARVVPRATPRTVHRWRTGAVSDSRSAARWDPVDDLYALTCRFLADGTYGPKGIVAWLRSRQPTLGWDRPLDVLRDDPDGFRRVSDAVARDLAAPSADGDGGSPQPLPPGLLGEGGA